MKKIVAFLLVLLFIFPVNVFAVEENVEDATQMGLVYEYYDDGSYLVLETIVLFEEYSNQLLTKGSDNYVVGGSRTLSYYDGDDNLDWTVTITGEFLIVPSNSTQSGFCQSSTLTYKIYDSSWHIYNIVEQEITNNACVSCTMKRKFLGITTKTVDVSLHITCDYAGNLS